MVSFFFFSSPQHSLFSLSLLFLQRGIPRCKVVNSIQKLTYGVQTHSELVSGILRVVVPSRGSVSEWQGPVGAVGCARTIGTEGVD